MSRWTSVSSSPIWACTILLTVGAVLTSGAWEQERPQLRRPLGDVVRTQLGEYRGQDVVISEAEQEVAGFSDYLMRLYEAPDSTAVAVPWVSTYVGYYDSQTRGQTIHSPKNCLPGGGWEALSSRREVIPTAAGDVEVNRYLLQREGERALVLYWYQGRGRVVASEYRAKWDLLRDAAIMRRSDEALVRVVVPIRDSEQAAFEVASAVAAELKVSVDEALPL